MTTTDPEVWLPARLIPTAGIRRQEEQERRATSALLAVMVAVPEFAKAVLGYLGAPAGRVSTFVEVPLKGKNGESLRPDGAIVVERGQRKWSCLVEVKTGNSLLRADQVDAYLGLARDYGFDGVLTISNEIAAAPGEVPVAVDRRRLRSTNLAHLSWWRILTEAIIQHEHRGVSDPDQAWILGELIAYLRHPSAGAGAFEDLGEHWVTVRDAARQQTLRPGDEVAAVVGRWEEFTQYLCLGLSQELGRDVLPVYPRNQDQSARQDSAGRMLVESGRLSSRLKIPDVVGPLDIVADLRARQVTTSVDIKAPGEGRAKTRVNWLLRQVKGGPGGIRIEAQFSGSQKTSSCMADACADDPELLLLPGDHSRAPRAFTVALTKEMGRKRGAGDDSFVRETQRQLLLFYRELVQNLRPWTARAPRIRKDADDEFEGEPLDMAEVDGSGQVPPD